MPHLGAPPQRIAVDTELVRQLVADQFPQWSDLPVRPVANGGWDNWTFRLGTEKLVRLPSAAEYALAVEKEHRWLPVLALMLPLPISTPLAKGQPSADYPFPWSVYRWIDGDPVSLGSIADPTQFALDLADFLSALQGVETAGGPLPGAHNWFRGGTLRTYDDITQHALEAIEGQVDVSLARGIWATALHAPWDGVQSWFHGDIAEGNLLVNDGKLAAVIDFGTCGVGDPSCDLAVAWTTLTAEGRQAFRERLAVDEAAWARGRGWALWKTLTSCAQTTSRADEGGDARRVLQEIFGEYETGGAAHY